MLVGYENMRDILDTKLCRPVLLWTYTSGMVVADCRSSLVKSVWAIKVQFAQGTRVLVSRKRLQCVIEVIPECIPCLKKKARVCESLQNLKKA